MPTLYEYRCIDPACRALFTLWRYTDRRNDPVTCPECGCAGRRVISRPLRAGVPATMTPEEVRRSEEVWG